MNLTKSHTTLKLLLCGAFVLVVLLILSSISLAQEPITAKAPMPTARFSMGSAVVDGKIYVIGGYQTEGTPISVVEVYDPFTDSWDTKTPMPTARGTLGCAVADGKIYAIGGGVVGSVNRSIVEVYDPATDSWDTKTPMPTARNEVATCTVNGKIYVIGGTYQIGGTYAGIGTVEEYDPATDKWTTKKDKPTPCWGLRACVLEGKIYVAGGNVRYPNISAALEVYDPVKDEWDNTKALMPEAKYSHSISALNEHIYSFGGWNNCSTGPFYTKVEIYNPTTDTWTQSINMPLKLGELSTVTANDKIYIIGGTCTLHSFVSVKNLYEYDPHLDLFPLIEKIEIYKSYVNPGADSVCITTKMSDPTGITLIARIKTHDQTPVDSLQLFDDGSHNDEIAGDGLYANFWPVGSSEEPYYYVDLQVTRIDMDTVINLLNNVAQLTTIGPVTLEGYLFASSDTVFDPGDGITIKLTLKNEDLATTAPNIEAKLISLDTLVMVSAWSRTFGDLEPGESSTSDYYGVAISDDWSGNSQLLILVEISSNDYVYWKDTIIIPGITDIHTFNDPGAHPLKIYPNPTDNLLNIEINNTGSQGVKIEILTITGELISTKEYKNINASFAEQIDLSNYAKGIYLVKVRQAHAFYVRKVVIR
jgi:N-acetylneuraminic acid mutarotase